MQNPTHCPDGDGAEADTCPLPPLHTALSEWKLLLDCGFSFWGTGVAGGVGTL